MHHLASARKWKSCLRHSQSAWRAEKTLETKGNICRTISLFYLVWYCYYSTCWVANKNQSQNILCSLGVGKESFQLCKDGASGWQESPYSSFIIHRTVLLFCPPYLSVWVSMPSLPPTPSYQLLIFVLALKYLLETALRAQGLISAKMNQSFIRHTE